MAPLYKRYIPPKPAVEPSIVTNTAPPVAPVVPSADTPERQKRKRERSQEEVVERRAKKLKKKGIDPATALQLATAPTETTAAAEDVQNAATAAETADNAIDQGQSDFAHVKSAKKRHKLEKAAREARKAAEKSKNFSGHLEEYKKDTSTAPQPVPNIQQDNYVDETPDQEKPVLHTPDFAAEPQPVAEAVGSSDYALPRKRRHKLEAVLEAAQTAQAPNEGDTEHLRKHAALLGKFHKSASQSLQMQQEENSGQLDKESQQPVVRDLELPEQGSEPTPEFASQDAALPPWLANPTIISDDAQKRFADMSLPTDTADRLAKLGFTDALPVQQSLVPLLLPPGTPGSKFLPRTEPIVPDMAVSAPTGSGKTIAYVLPILESLKLPLPSGRLSALIIVPTRELVLQVAAVAESLAKGSNIKVGIATGKGKVADEQHKLIRRGRRYDPEGYAALMKKAKYQWHPPDKSADEFEDHSAYNEQDDVKSDQKIQDAIACLVNHVPTYDSAVEILVATPGRLLEHLDTTVGFNLVHLQWLVIDEADKLLDNEYEGFLEVLNSEVTRPRTSEEGDPREQYLRSRGIWNDRRERRLRKVVLSATMTRDISKLTSLKLQRPQLLVVRGREEVQASAGAGTQLDAESSVRNRAEGYELPRNLMEYCVPVGDGSEKPLVVVELLTSRIIKEAPQETLPQVNNDTGPSQESDDDSSSDSESDSSMSSEDSASSSESDDSEDDEDEKDLSEDESGESALDAARSRRLAAMAPKRDTASKSQAPTVLVFTSSNEAATRLSHLLNGLKPEWSKWITTLVKTNPGKARIRSKATEPAIVISTDRAARGLDSLSSRPITHVIQYDVPRSVTSYVHRVGRTARAGRDGDAWTLFTHSEARWFMTDITKTEQITRIGSNVERVKIFMSDEQIRGRYERVLAGMRDEVLGQ